MPPYFHFGEEELSKIPVWIRLRNLPLELWSKKALGKILSKVGKPLRTDHLTATRGSISFARALVEVDAAKALTQMVVIQLPDGSLINQAVEYENEPTFCNYCKTIGHEVASCTYAPKGSAISDNSADATEASKGTDSAYAVKVDEANVSPSAIHQDKALTASHASVHATTLGQQSRHDTMEKSITPSCPPNDGFTIVTSKTKRKKFRSLMQHIHLSKVTSRPFKAGKKPAKASIAKAGASLARNGAAVKDRVPFSPTKANVAEKAVQPFNSPATRRIAAVLPSASKPPEAVSSRADVKSKKNKEKEPVLCKENRTSSLPLEASKKGPKKSIITGVGESLPSPIL
ncbi:uncharacterized protein LOC133290735 [Gastrolobium bilobum]|uniref:uncharacterized protein LOC133290735 n=1 Tax=Gastrolobium bilobum TaxID=150636 RepID=UPI002AAF2EE8|nr:uncharacterized protein LOC133290735 [Gastrolobium bilobum]